MDLSTMYMGLKLANPLVPSSSPLTADIDTIRQLEDSGASAIVLHSLFEEQIRHEGEELEFYTQYGAERSAEAQRLLPELEYTLGPQEYLDHIHRTKHAVKIPVIASLNGISAGGWTSYAILMQQAGADAIELNIYYLPTEGDLSAEQIEAAYLMVLKAVKVSVTIPVSVKLSPFFSSTANIIRQLDSAGADGLVLFNRFLQPDLDIENLQINPTHTLSHSEDSRVAIRWVALTSGRVRCSLAVTNGIHTGLDVAKAILAGADVIMTASALLKHGPKHLQTMRRELEDYMARKEYESIEQMKGVLSQQRLGQPAGYERANYIRTLRSYGPTATLE